MLAHTVPWWEGLIAPHLEATTASIMTMMLLVAMMLLLPQAKCRHLLLPFPRSAASLTWKQRLRA
jgi:hypothetical protein